MSGTAAEWRQVGQASVLASAEVSGTGRQQTAECSSKLGVEHGVDDRVEEAVDVSEPDEEREQCRMYVAHRTAVYVVADADSVDDVERKERKPASQKHTCTRQRIEIDRN